MGKEFDVHYGEDEIKTVESGIEAIETVLMGEDIHARERLLFYLDWYMDPFYRQDLSAIEEPLKELLQRVIVTDNDIGVAEEALHLLEAYTDGPYTLLGHHIDDVDKDLKPTVLHLLESQSTRKDFGLLNLSSDEVTYAYNGEVYRLSSNIYEPCLFIWRNKELVCALHNAYTTKQLVDEFTAGNTIKTGFGKDYEKEYDEACFCKVLAAAIDSGRDDMDLFYAAKLAKERRCHQRPHF